MSGWRVLVAETLSGRIMADVVPAEVPSFQRAVNDAGEWSVDVLIGERANSAVDFHVYTESGKYSWIIAYGEHIVQAGPVWTYSFADETGMLSVSGSNLVSIFDKRVLRNPNGHSYIAHPSEDLHYTGMSLRGILTAMVRDNMAQPGHGLPLDLPDVEAGNAERHYYGYDLATVGERIGQLSEVQNGPEYDARPYFVPGENRVRWHLDIGSPLLGDPKTVATWDYGGALGRIDIDVDGSQAPTARVWVKGDGSERELRTGFASDDRELAGQGYPPLDYVDSEHTSVTEQPTLESYADRYLADYRYPSEEWTVSVRIDGAAGLAPALPMWALGDAPVFFVDNHPWLPDGGYRRRILGYSDDGAEHVALTLDETPLTEL